MSFSAIAYDGFVMPTSLFKSMNKLLHCPTAVRVNNLSYKDDNNEVVDVTIVGDPRQVGPNVNSSDGFRLHAPGSVRASLHQHSKNDDDLLRAIASAKASGSRVVVPSGFAFVNVVDKDLIHCELNWSELRCDYGSSFFTEPDLEHSFCDVCFKKFSTGDNRLILCDHQSVHHPCLRGRHQKCCVPKVQNSDVEDMHHFCNEHNPSPPSSPFHCMDENSPTLKIVESAVVVPSIVLDDTTEMDLSSSSADLDSPRQVIKENDLESPRQVINDDDIDSPRQIVTNSTSEHQFSPASLASSAFTSPSCSSNDSSYHPSPRQVRARSHSDNRPTKRSLHIEINDAGTTRGARKPMTIDSSTSPLHTRMIDTAATHSSNLARVDEDDEMVESPLPSSLDDSHSTNIEEEMLVNQNSSAAASFIPGPLYMATIDKPRFTAPLIVAHANFLWRRGDMRVLTLSDNERAMMGKTMLSKLEGKKRIDESDVAVIKKRQIQMTKINVQLNKMMKEFTIISNCKHRCGVSDSVVDGSMHPTPSTAPHPFHSPESLFNYRQEKCKTGVIKKEHVYEHLVNRRATESKDDVKYVTFYGRSICIACFQMAIGYSDSSMRRMHRLVLDKYSLSPRSLKMSISMHGSVTMHLATLIMAMIQIGYGQTLPTANGGFHTSIHMPFTTKSSFASQILLFASEKMGSTTEIARMIARNNQIINPSSLRRAFKFIQAKYNIIITIIKTIKFMRCTACAKFDCEKQRLISTHNTAGFGPWARRKHRHLGQVSNERQSCSAVKDESM